MLISPSFRNIANYIFSNLTPSTKCFSNERDKNNICIVTIIKIFLIFRFFPSPAAKPSSIAALKIVVFCSGEVIDTSMAADFPKDQFVTETSPGLRIVPGIKLAVSKDGDKPAEL